MLDIVRPGLMIGTGICSCFWPEMIWLGDIRKKKHNILKYMPILLSLISSKRK